MHIKIVNSEKQPSRDGFFLRIADNCFTIRHSIRRLAEIFR